MGRPFVIGIAGGTASGKSTFCTRLEDALPECRRITYHMDDYFKPEHLRPFVEAPITGKKYVDDNHPETMDLARLKADMDASMGEPYDLMIVEGLLTLWDREICARLDMKLFVDCPPDERIVRRLRRNMAWGQGFDEISGVYLDMVRYRHDEYVEVSKWKADVILNGAHPSDTAMQAITGHVRKHAFSV